MKEFMKEMQESLQESLQTSMKTILNENITQIKDQIIAIDSKLENMQKQLLENTKKLKDISKKIDK